VLAINFIKNQQPISYLYEHGAFYIVCKQRIMQMCLAISIQQMHKKMNLTKTPTCDDSPSDSVQHMKTSLAK